MAEEIFLRLQEPPKIKQGWVGWRLDSEAVFQARAAIMASNTWWILTSSAFQFNICLCLPPDRTWHKVNDPKVDYSGSLGEGKVKNELGLKPCWTILVTGPISAMWAWWA